MYLFFLSISSEGKQDSFGGANLVEFVIETEKKIMTATHTHPNA